MHNYWVYAMKISSLVNWVFEIGRKYFQTIKFAINTRLVDIV